MKVKPYSLIILAVIMFLCLVGWTSYAQKPTPTKAAWEYKVTDFLSESELNHLGAEGWELVAVSDTGNTEGRTHETTFYLKRAK